MSQLHRDKLGHPATVDSTALFESIARNLSDCGYSVVEHFLPAVHIQHLREALLIAYRGGQFHKAGVGAGATFRIAAETRGDFILWIDPATAAPPVQDYLSIINQLMLFLNRTCFLSLKAFEAHFAVYPAGTGYRRHLDQTRGSSHRRLTVILYLNEEWKPEHGGHLRLYLTHHNAEETVCDILPCGGTAVVFRSDQIEHEVLPATRERYSITGWLRDRFVEYLNTEIT
jgi:SM-20-related protein